jgi:hypothetical protein
MHYNIYKRRIFGALVLIQASGTLTWGEIDVSNVFFSECGDVEGRSTRLEMLFAVVGVGWLVGPLIFYRNYDAIMNGPYITNAFYRKMDK